MIFLVRRYLLFIVFFLFAQCSAQQSSDVIVTTTTAEYLGVSTTTQPSTTLALEEVPVLNIEITNCPSDVVDIEIGESFKIEFFVQAGSSDVTSIFYYFELNGEYYSRLPLDKENHSDYFDFPTWHNITESATFVEKQADGDVYYIYIDVFDDELNSVSTECEVKF